jgi:EmrB/QacA subfamily drug resistance transporter
MSAAVPTAAGLPREASPAPDRSVWHGLQRRWWAVLVVLPALFMTGMNTTVTDLARPFVVTELSSDRYRFQWVTGATLLGMVAGMSLIRWARDRFGLKASFLAGLVLYALGSLACATAPNMEALGLARFVQSWGNGMTVTTVLAVLWREFPENEDGAMAVYVLGLYFGRIVAPSVSAFLINAPSWRSIFFANVPVGCLAAFFAARVLRPDQPRQDQRPRFDFPGLALLIAWVSCLMLGLYRFQKWGWATSPTFWLVTGLGALAFTAFLLRQFTADEPLLGLRLFAIRRFALSVIIKALADVHFFTTLGLLTRYMAVTRDYQRSTAGLVLLPAAATMATTLLLTAQYGTRRSRKPRLVVGLIGMAVMAWQMSGFDLFTDKRWIALVVAAWGLFAGLIASPLICISQEDMDAQQVAASASIKNLGLTLPASVGGSLFSILTERRADAHFDALRQTLTHNRPPLQDVESGLVDYFTMQGLDPAGAARQAGRVLAGYVRDTAAVYANQSAFQFLALGLAVAVVLALLLKPLPPHARGPHRG